MTLGDKTMILYALRSIDHTYENIHFEMCGEENLFIRIDEECDGEMYVVYKKPHTKKESHIFLR